MKLIDFIDVPDPAHLYAITPLPEVSVLPPDVAWEQWDLATTLLDLERLKEKT